MVNDLLAPGLMPPGLRVYAVGDVHGCADRLAALHGLIAADARARPARQTVLVHLGDYVDRGPNSARVLELLSGPPPVAGAEVVNLVGNHEVMMLDAADPLSHPGAWEFWLENGGAETLRSYGGDLGDPEPFAPVPKAHLEMLRACPLHWSAGDYLFVHAGIRPAVPLNQQDPFDLIWIREPFLSFDGDLPMVVVHGHTPTATPSIRQNRLGIDTGACFGGALTCLVLEEQRMGFLTA
jgi:serine/threonine protein phosphatase 1